MFTGIVTDLGRIEALEPLAEGVRLTVATAYDTGTLDIGASVAHNGVCLTVTGKTAAHGNMKASYTVEAWSEALAITTIASWQPGQRINLERALKVGDELGGHIVSGHVDGVAEVVSATPEGDAVRYVLRAPHALAGFIAPKGSVALDGTSLTVNRVDGDSFDVLIIRHTQDVTTWGSIKAGDKVNIEIDTMARYAARLLQHAGLAPAA